MIEDDAAFDRSEGSSATNRPVAILLFAAQAFTARARRDERGGGLAMALCKQSRRVGLARSAAAASILAVILLVLIGRPAEAQVAPGDSVPTRLYYNTLNLYSNGDYRDALGGFTAEGRSGIKTPISGLWIDSICYFTMAGECYYQLGQLPAALESYSAALKLYITHSNWLMRVQFPAIVAPALATNVRIAPWGQSRRNAMIGQFPDTYLMGQGQIDNSAAIINGGVVQQPIMVPVNVIEILRCTSQAIRRRHELLGPLSKSDPLTKDVLDVLARRPGPPNHWSEAWINVQLGCAYAAAGNLPQANTALTRGLLVAGEYDHPLASTALIVMGRLALDAGDFQAAARNFEEATYSCINYPNATNLEEAFRLGLLAHQLLNQKVPYPPLAPAIAWSKTQGFRHLQTSLLLLGAENMLGLNNTSEAGNLLALARTITSRSDLTLSQTGARMNYLTALASYQLGNVPAGDTAIQAALGFEHSGSLWLFQIGMTDSRYVSGAIRDREAMQLYEATLREPTPADWLSSPLECLAMLSTPHGQAIEHWFETALTNNREQELALEIADRARRHRFYSTLPLGGRLLSLRWILEGPVDLLGERGLLERQDLLLRFPKYGQLAQQATQLRAKLAAQPLADPGQPGRREQATDLAALGDISQNQEIVLREIALSREPAEMVFPPLRKTKDVQAALADGTVLLAFFATGDNLYAFLYSREKYAAWEIQNPVLLRKQIGLLLKEMGNYDSNHEVTTAEFDKSNWRGTAAKVMNLLLDKSNVDLAGNFDEIVIVPDGVLWYLPFEALPIGKAKDKNLLGHVRVRYAPTVGLAVPYGRAHRPKPHVGLVVGKLHPQNDESLAQSAQAEFTRSVGGATVLPRSLPAPSSIYRTLLDGLIVLEDIPATDGPYDWSPAQVDRGKSGASLANWLALPWGGVEHVILPGFHTAAESGLRRSHANGNELFLSLCGLMSAGTRTVLISRWRPGGQSSYDLVREFAQELPHISPAEAWQRSVQVASETQIEPEHEPRIKRSAAAGEPPTAAHPFFWAGFMLVDSGVLPPGQDQALAIDKAVKPPAAMPVPPANPQANVNPQGNGPANPPAARGVPMPAPGDPAAEDAPSAKRAKKGRSVPNAMPKKAPARKKPAPVDDPD